MTPNSTNAALSSALGLLMLVSCASAPPVAGQVAATGGDSAVFATILDALRSHAHNIDTLRVDPRPIRFGATRVTAEEMLQGSEGEVESRSLAIRTFGLSVGDAAFPKACAGTMSPDAPGKPSHDGCPKTWRTVAAVSAPTPYSPAIEDSLPGRQLWAARVVLVTMGPGGINAESSDYILSRRDGRWKFEKAVVRGYWE